MGKGLLKKNGNIRGAEATVSPLETPEDFTTHGVQGWIVDNLKGGHKFLLNIHSDDRLIEITLTENAVWNIIDAIETADMKKSPIDTLTRWAEEEPFSDEEWRRYPWDYDTDFAPWE